MPFCTECGGKFPTESAKFCQSCGAKKVSADLDRREPRSKSEKPKTKTNENWLYLSKDEQVRREKILEFIIKDRSDFFHKYEAFRYQFAIGRTEASAAQEAMMSSINETWESGADVARSPTLTVREMGEFAQSSVVDVRMNLSRNLLAPAEILSKLAVDKDWNVKVGVASNPNTPQVTVETLLSDQSLVTFASSNAGLTQDFIASCLSNLNLGNSRFCFLQNWNTSFIEISSHWNNAGKNRAVIAEYLARNPMLPAEYFAAVAGFVADELANPKISARKFDLMFEIASNLVGNPGLPAAVLKSIKSDIPGVFREWPHLNKRPKCLF